MIYKKKYRIVNKVKGRECAFVCKEFRKKMSGRGKTLGQRIHQIYHSFRTAFETYTLVDMVLTLGIENP